MNSLSSRPVRVAICAALLHAACPVGADAAPDSRVFPVGHESADARLGSRRTLDSYHPWPAITDPDAWRARAREVRRRVLVAAGLWPAPEPTPLSPVIHGRIDREGYTVEKVFFASYPGFYVTGNLYRPTGRTGRLPAVLSPHGHWSNGRFYRNGDAGVKSELEQGAEKTEAGARYPLQARCAMLARMGCVVFHYDMVGYADSTQIRHREGFTDVEAELRLQSFFGLQTYNTLRALDFLAGLPDVDASRIGVTGASGGGTQTFILSAIDPRPAVSFPAVMVSTGMQGGCICENASHLRVGCGNIELAAMCVPRPLGMTGADDWTIEIETKGLPDLVALYRSHGVEDRVMAKCLKQFKHNYNQVSREVMYGWMSRHLGLGLVEPIEERPFEPVEPAELSVFDDAHPRPADAVDAAGLRAHLSAASDRQMAALWPRTAWSLERFRTVVGGALETITATRLPKPWEITSRRVGLETSDELASSGATVERVALSRQGAGEEVPVLVLKPPAWNGSVVVVLHPEGKERVVVGADHGSVAQAILSRGAAVVAPDVFLTGELRAGGGAPGAVDGRYAGYTFGYNRSTLANRVHDVLTAVAFARTLRDHASVRLAGIGEAGLWAGLASALAGDAVARVAIEDTGFRFAQIDRTDHPAMLSGALKYGDVPAFLALRAPGELRIVGDAGHLEPLVRDAYIAAGAPKAARALSRDGVDLGELLDWLATTR